MNLCVNSIRKSIIPKGNGIARQYRRNINTNKCLKGVALTSAAGGVAALITKEPNIAASLMCLSIGSATVARFFEKNAKALNSQFQKILNKVANINK